MWCCLCINAACDIMWCCVDWALVAVHYNAGVTRRLFHAVSIVFSDANISNYLRRISSEYGKWQSRPIRRWAIAFWCFLYLFVAKSLALWPPILYMWLFDTLCNLVPEPSFFARGCRCWRRTAKHCKTKNKNWWIRNDKNTDLFQFVSHLFPLQEAVIAMLRFKSGLSGWSQRGDPRPWDVQCVAETIETFRWPLIIILVVI